MFPSGRSNLYTIYRACERMGLMPPDVCKNWDDNTSYTKAHLLAYSQIREQEEAERCGSALL